MIEIWTAFLSIYSEVRPILGGVLCVVGAVLTVVGAVGVLRFPDFYSRLHAASVIDTSGATALLLGMALLAPSWLVVAKLAVVWLFMFISGPTAAHAAANAAHTAGLQPIIGRAARGRSEGEDAQ